MLRVVTIASQASPRLLRTLACFGLGVRIGAVPRPAPPRPTIARVCHLAQIPGSITLVSGHSGGGKSTLLRAARQELTQRRVRTRMLNLGRWAPQREVASVLDAVRGPRDHALDLLNAVGLGDALLLAQDPNTLSEGQAARLRIACAVAELVRLPQAPGDAPFPGPRVLLIDEFASVLDRTSAMVLCLALARLVRSRKGLAGQSALSLILATAHDDVKAWLKPDLLIRCDPHATSTSSHPADQGDVHARTY